jgi:HEAT repeat protein
MVTAVGAVVGWAWLAPDAGVHGGAAGLPPADPVPPPAVAEVSAEPGGAAEVAPGDTGAGRPEAPPAAERARPEVKGEPAGPPAPTRKVVSSDVLCQEAAPAEIVAEPALAGVAARAAPAAEATVKRRRSLTEGQLRKQLAWVPEVKSLTVPAINSLVQSYTENYRVNSGVSPDLGPGTLLRFRGDIGYLPVRGASRLTLRDALTLQTLSRKLRVLLQLAAPNDTAGRRPLPVLLQEILRSRKTHGRPEWLRPEAVPVLQQLLMHEDKAVRLMLVDLLAEIRGPAADRALAQRAVMDLAPDVREAALRVLRDRPLREARPVLLRALRYPWVPVADHAAEALVYLKDQEAVPLLVALLREPDPAGPFPGSGGRTFLRELVRIHHEANCLLCHPPAITRGDPVARAVPGVALHQTSDRIVVLNVEQLPPGLQGAAQQQNLQSRIGGGYSGSSASLGPLYIRADVTFMHQDFSISELVGEPGAVALLKPRFDFVVRTRPARTDELRPRSADPSRYEQREAVLWALRQLTGQDPGPVTTAWRALYPRAEFDADTAALADQLVAARGARRDQLLGRLRIGQGAVYTQALAAAIPRLGHTAQIKARAALADRLTRMTTQTLAEQLRDDSPEIRRAAALACAAKKSQDNIPDLEPLLDDPEPPVAAAARDALRQLTGEDPGAAPKSAPEKPTRSGAP